MGKSSRAKSTGMLLFTTNRVATRRCVQCNVMRLPSQRVRGDAIAAPVQRQGWHRYGNATVLSRSGNMRLAPRVVGDIRRPRAVQVRDVECLRARIDARIKVTTPGAFTVVNLAQDGFSGDRRRIAVPDWGMKHLPRIVAFAKLKARADGATIVRRGY